MARRAVALLLLAACTSGCSVQLAYNNLDRLARWSMSDLIDMNPQQQAYFDAAFDTTWRWHRETQLPEYAAFLDDVAVRFVDGTSEAEMQAAVDRAVAWFDVIEARGLPHAAELLASLSDAQVADLAVALDASNVEFAETEQGVSVAEAQRLWGEEFADRFSDFSGRLTPVQREYLAEQARRYIPELTMWVDYRQRWQADRLALLAFRGDAAGFAAGLEDLARHRDLYYGPVAEVFAANQALTREVSVWLINSFNDRQRARFTERVAELAEDFRELAAQPGAPPGEIPCLVDC